MTTTYEKAVHCPRMRVGREGYGEEITVYW
jgi:hypothetical protein